MSWTDAWRPVPRLWIRSAEVRGGGGGGRGASLGEWEHNSIFRVFIFQIILIFDFFSFKINFLLVVYLNINKHTTFINILVFGSKYLFQI